MPVNPNVFERLLFYRLNRGPAAVLDLIGAGGLKAAVLAGRLGVFDRLNAGSRSLADLAADVGADPDGLDRLLGLLAELGYVERDSSGFTNTPMTNRWLTDASGTDLLPWLDFWERLAFPFWEAQLEATVREGRPDETLYEWIGDDEDAWRIAQDGFRAAATLTLAPVLERLPVGDGDAVLDLGGGHGEYGAAIAERYPNVEVTLFDLPPALGPARETVADRDLEERVDLVGGDYRTDDLGGPYDLVLLFNVLHAQGPQANRDLLRRVAEVLEDGGRVAVLDQFAGTSRFPVGRAMLAFIDLTYAVTLDARAHPFEAVSGWMESAGFESIDRVDFRRAPGLSLVTATRA